MFRTWAKSSSLLVSLVAVPLVSTAQKPAVIPIVPAANWRLMNTQVLDVDAVRQWGGDPAIEREYGVKALELQTYRLNEKLAQAILEPAQDATSAYGLVKFYQTEKMAPEKGMQLTVTGPDGALLGRGRFFIRVPRPSDKNSQLSENDFRALLVYAAGTRPSVNSLANLPDSLPSAGLVPGSEKYLLGLEAARRVLPAFQTDLLGFSQGAEVQVGDYVAGKGRVTLLAIAYPTPQIARVRLGAMEKMLAVNQDRGPGSLFGQRKGSFVLLVLNSDSAATATRLMDQFRFSRQVSPNERYPGDKPVTLQVAELLIANILFVIFLAGIAIAGGLIVVLARKAIGKFLPHSAWADVEGGTIISLNLR